MQSTNVGAFIVRIGFWSPFFYKKNQESKKIALVIIQAAVLSIWLHCFAFDQSDVACSSDRSPILFDLFVSRAVGLSGCAGMTLSRIIRALIVGLREMP